MSSRKLLNLRKAISDARQAEAKKEQIYLMLSLIEHKALETPYFCELPEGTVFHVIINTLKDKLHNFYREYHKSFWIEENFINYLATQMEFAIDKNNVGEIKETYNTLMEKGEKDYEFRSFK